MLSFSQLPAITHGSLLQIENDPAISHLLTDSRKLAQPATTLFFAIRGIFNDGHHYVNALYARGVRQFIIEDLDNILGIKTAGSLPLSFPGACFILVESSLAALQAIAQNHREQFVLPVIGITGSNGKTIVKEWLAQLLAPNEKVVKSPRSYNSQIGVPLSVWQITEEHTLGIFEAGISQPEEMEKLEKIIRPTIGIFTNIGFAHDDGIVEKTTKIKKKLRLFANAELLFYCADELRLTAALKESETEIETFTWGYHENANLLILAADKTETKTSIKYRYQEKESQIALPLTDAASIENSLHCLAFLIWKGFTPEAMQPLFDKLQPVAMRLEMKEAINNCYLIDDTYNNDLAGL